jgi:hypothetical protein
MDPASAACGQSLKGGRFSTKDINNVKYLDSGDFIAIGRPLKLP